MASPKVIDNYKGNDLSKYLNKVLPDCISAKFGVGYFFISGLEEIIFGVSNLKELKLLISNTTNQKTKETLLEGFKRIQLADEELRKTSKLNSEQRFGVVRETEGNIRKTLEVMEQNKSEENIVNTFLKMMDEKQIKVKVITTEKLHAKAYLLKLKEGSATRMLQTDRIGIVGSSNLSIAGLKQSSELNLVTFEQADNEHLDVWFDRLWAEAEEFTDDLNAILNDSWVKQEPTPHEVYIKGMLNEMKERLGDTVDELVNPFGSIGPHLYEFQLRSVHESINLLKRYRGMIVADVVGLGKTYVAAGIAKLLQMTEAADPLVIVPPVLEKKWRNVFRTYQIKAEFVSRGDLTKPSEEKPELTDNYEHQFHNLVIIDESHHFRRHVSNQYKNIKRYLDADENRKVLLLTATPFGVSYDDLFNQIKLFHKTDRTEIPIGTESLRLFQKGVEEKIYRMPDLLKHVMIRRTRKYILDTYGTLDKKTNRRYIIDKRTKEKIFFPDRELGNAEYDIQKVYNNKFGEITDYFRKDKTGNLTLARFGLGYYVKEEKRESEQKYQILYNNGRALVGLMRILLLKRMESSIAAFKATIHKMKLSNEIFLEIVKTGKIPIGEFAQKMLYDIVDDYDFNDVYQINTGESLEENVKNAIAQIEKTKSYYNIDDFNSDELKQDLSNDIEIFTNIYELINELGIEANDDKFDQLAKIINKNPKEKILIFSEYADTVKYIFKRLQTKFPKRVEEIEVVYSEKASKKDQNKITYRFAPIANKSLIGDQKLEPLNILVSTDVISEGTDLQDAGFVISYDFHWNLSRLIQRAGRIDRIGQEREIIKLTNFLPDSEIDKQLNLAEKVRKNIDIFHSVIGSDDPVLEPSERADPTKANALYAKKDATIIDVEDEDLLKTDTLEKKLHDIEKMDEEYYRRIQKMQDGMRTASRKNHDGSAAVVIAFQAGNFRRYYKIDLEKNVKPIPWPEMERYLEEDKNAKRIVLPENYNEYIKVAKNVFEKEFKNYRAGPSARAITVEQRWLLGELNKMSTDNKLKDKRAEIFRLIQLFKPKVDNQWLIQDLRSLKFQYASRKISDQELLDEVTDLTTSTAKFLLKRQEQGIEEEVEIPQVLYSKYLKAT